MNPTNIYCSCCSCLLSFVAMVLLRDPNATADVPSPGPRYQPVVQPAVQPVVPADSPAAPQTPGAAPTREAERAGPSLERVQRASLRRAQLDPGRARNWLRDARRAAILPQVDVSWEHRYDRGWQHDIEPGLPDELQNGHDATDVWRVKATWKLERLWFNPDELRASRAQSDLARWRNELLAEVTHMYFERLRALAREQDPAASATERAGASLQRRELEGRLTALTGLRWS